MSSRWSRNCSADRRGEDGDRCRPVGHLPDLEQAAVTWWAGQHRLDSLGALVVAHDVLVHSIGQQLGFSSPLDTERRAREGTITSLAGWMTRRIGG